MIDRASGSDSACREEGRGTGLTQTPPTPQRSVGTHSGHTEAGETSPEDGGAVGGTGEQFTAVSPPHTGRPDTERLQTVPKMTEASEGQEEDMEVVLLRAEMEVELGKMARDRERLEGICNRMETVNRAYQAEREKEKGRVERQRAELEEVQGRLQETQRRLGERHESSKEWLREKLKEEAEAVDSARKAFEDVEFQALERLSSLEEERETRATLLVQEETQTRQRIRSREERLQHLEMLMGRVQEPPSNAGPVAVPQDNAARTPGKRSKTVRPPSRESVAQKNPTETVPGQCVFTSLSVTQGILKDPVMCRNFTGSFRRNRREMRRTQESERPGSMQEEDLALPPIHLLSLIALHRSKSFGASRPTILGHSGNLDLAPENCPRRRGGRSRVSRASSLHEDSLSLLAEMERKLRAAMAERERLLQARETGRETVEGLKRGTDGNEQVHNKRTSIAARQEQSHRLPVDRSPAPPLDLRSHVEALGHGVGTCHHLLLNSSSCRGLLTKVGHRIKTWRKRWFVFDSSRGHLSYYADQGEMKRKGVIYFQAFEEVYFDHLRDAPKSPNPLLTFCLKTYDRLYFLVAPSDVALRIWMEVFLTAVEGAGHF